MDSDVRLLGEHSLTLEVVCLSAEGIVGYAALARRLMERGVLTPGGAAVC